MFLWIKEKRPVHKRLMINVCTTNLILQRTGKPVKSSSSAHTMKEQFALAEHRDIASFDADDEFNRANDEENVDFNIPGVPNSVVKRSHGVNVRNLIQKIENHPQQQALQSDLQQHRQFNLFSKVISYEMIRNRTRSTSSQFLTSSLFRIFTSGKVDHTVTDTERKNVIKISHCESTSKEV